MKVTLAVCTNRGIRPKTAQCLMELVNKSRDFHIVVAERGYTIAENRNYCVVQAQKNSSDYLFFVDDDMVFPSDTLDRLLSHKVGVVGVNSMSRCLPLSSTVGLMDENGKYKHPDKYPSFQMKIPENLFRAYFVGCGICLIDMKVFEQIEKPYFEFTTYKEGDFKGMVENGEDGTFCDKVRKSGVDVWCDGSVKVGHLGEYEYKKEVKEEVVGSKSVESNYAFTIKA